MIRVLASLTAAVLVLAACSGVPSSSAPQVIGPAIGGSAPLPTDTPQPNAEPRSIVQEFLRANVAEPIEPRGAREFLTPDEQRQWSDRTLTILQGSVQDAHVGVAETNSSHTVWITVQGTQVGALSMTGTYTPLLGSDGGVPWSGRYELESVKGQSRIRAAPDGLVVYADDFARVYQAVRLYFLDLREKRLVPDVRYTALTSKQALASWELNQLTSGPRIELANAVRNEVPSLPPSTPPSVVVNGLVAQVELPGSSHLEGDIKLRLAAQLLATLQSLQPQLKLTITDGGAPIDVMGLPDPLGPADFADIRPQPAPNAQTHFFDGVPDPSVFYLDGTGRLVTGSGKPLDGPLGTHPQYDLNSVALTAVEGNSDYYVAACVGPDANQTLWLGQASNGLHKVDVPAGSLTRPSWLAGQREVWIANGANLYRVDYSGAVQQVPTTLLPGAKITALRLSPEGSRIAMIVTDAPGQSQLWVGAIVRSDTIETQGSTARVDGAEPILPPSYRLNDVAWGDDMTLWAVGSSGTDNGIWSVAVDGSGLRERSSAGLPQPQQADSITVSRTVLPWVSAGGYVFEQDSDWEGPAHHTTRGRNPIYQESYLD